MIENPQKAAAYLRYLKNKAGLTYRQIEESSCVSDSTAQSYFSGRVQAMRQETFCALASAMGGSLEDFDSWQPAVIAEGLDQQEMDKEMKIERIIDALRESFDSAMLHMEAAYNRSFEELKEKHQNEMENIHRDYTRALFRQRNEKYILFLILIGMMVFVFSPALAAPETPEAFADWFIEQGFEGRDYYAWEAVFDALTDGIDRSREASMPVEHPVFVAILTGTKYHSDESCPSLVNTDRVLMLDVEEAKERGFEACKRCTPNK